MTLKRPNSEAQKASRERLFKASKPTIRNATVEDQVWIRVNQKLLGIEMEDEEFQTLMSQTFSLYDEVLIIEDRNIRFGAEFGPVGMIAAAVRGSVYEPHATWFEWASPRNILRGMVAFLQKNRYRKLGVLVVHCLADSASFFRRMKAYVPLNYVGKIPDGDPAGRGNDYIFYQRCRNERFVQTENQ